MSSDVDLDALAAHVARELSRADQIGNRESAGAQRSWADRNRPPGTGNREPGTENPEAGGLATTSGSQGVRYVRDNARIAEFIDHTLLKAETTRADIDQLCSEALEHEFAAVCVNPVWVPRCAERLQGSRVAVATVVGFPLGANQTEIKAAETSLAVRQGASEIDMVAAVGHIKGGDWNHVADDIAAVVRAAAGRLVKVIIESAHLTPVEIIKASALAREGGAHYVKTSTGFHAAGGATAEAVALMTDLSPSEWNTVDQFFESEVFPVLTPLAVDPGHPFPYVSNLSLSLAVEIRDPDRGDDHFARVKVPKSLPRWVSFGRGNQFVPLEEVIGANLGSLFPGMQVLGWWAFKVTRYSDLELDKTVDEPEDLLAMIEEQVFQRRFGEVVRLEVQDDML